MSQPLTPDDHVRELSMLATHYEKAVKHFERGGAGDAPITSLYLRRAAAIRWVLALNAFGVAPDECVL